MHVQYTYMCASVRIADLCIAINKLTRSVSMEGTEDHGGYQATQLKRRARP